MLGRIIRIILLNTVLIPCWQHPVMAQSMLFGIEVSMNSSSIQERRLVTVDPKTGLTSTLYPKSLFSAYVNGSPAVDAVKGVYYILGRDGVGDTRLFGIDIETGKILSDPKLSDPNDIHQLAFNCVDGNLYGIEVSGNPSGRYFVRVNPSTAAITRLSSAAVFASYGSGSPALDFFKGIYYIVGRDFTGKSRLYGIDITTGTALTEPLLATSDAIHHLAFNCMDSTLYGLQVDVTPGERYLAKVDPVTGNVTVISKRSAFVQYVNGSPAIDPFKNVYYVIGYDSVKTMRLYALNLTTGRVMSRPKLSNPDAAHQLAFYNPCSISADFSFRDSCFGNHIDFRTRSSGLFEWNFGDPNSGLKNVSNRHWPVHVFSDTGIYQVKLKVKGCFGEDSMTQKVHISLLNKSSFLGNDTSICFGDSLLLDATTKDADYTWQDNSKGSTFLAVSKGKYWATLTGNKCALTDTIEVLFKDLPDLNLGEDTTLCGKDSLLLQVNEVGSSYLWHNGSTNSFFLVDTVGTYWVHRITQGCDMFDTILVGYHDFPEVDLGPDTALCIGDTLVLDASWTDAIYLWSDLSENSELKVDRTGSYSVTVTALGCSTEDSISVRFLGLPKFSFINDTFRCEGDTIVLRTTDVEGDYTWHDSSKKPWLLVFETGVYWLEVENKCGVYRDSAEVFFEPFSPVSLGKDTILCFGETLLLSAFIEDGRSYFWQDGARSATYRVVEPGEYHVRVSRRRCRSADTIQVAFTQKMDLNIGRDTTLCNGQSLLLDATVQGGSYTWKDGNEMAIRRIDSAGFYHVTVKVDRCSQKDSLQVWFEDCEVILKMPNVFSPNGDAYNEFWKPQISLNIVAMNTHVYNRWGQEVFNSNTTTVDWDGKSHVGKTLAPSVYFWVIYYVDRYGNELEQQGTVTLIR